MMEESRRIRLVFEEKDGILSESQKSEGFDRCLILLKPQHRTIADLRAYIFHAFQLHPSCPHGLLLYMDDFLLPPFESTDILKDNDIISVRKKRALLYLEGNNAANFVQELETVDKPPVKSGKLLLANEEFEKESGGYQSDEPEDESKEKADEEECTDESKEEHEEEHLEDSLHLEKSSGCNGTSRKRKVLQELRGSKKKKLRYEVQENLQNDVSKKKVENLHQNGCHVRKESLHKQKNAADLKKKTDADDNRKKAESSNNNMEAVPNTKGADQLQKNDNELQDASGGTQKVPSRSARRKKAKRRWIREMAKIQKEAASSQSEGLRNWRQTQAKDGRKKQNSWKQMPAQAGRRKHNSWKQKQANSDEKEDPNEPKGLLHWKPGSGKDTSDGNRKHEESNQNGSICEQTNQKREMEDEVVPVVIRPGHIRFEPLEKDQAVKQSELSGEPFQWNGITSKRQGQKWGKDKHTHSQRKDNGDLKGVHSENLNTQKERHLNPIDFDKLPFLSSFPGAGDVIGYRLLELSSSWTPELSSYRVGQVSWCNSASGKLLLTPVSEYPITFGKLGEDESDMPPDNSLYKQDGSLEIDFSALVDVRIVKSDDRGTAKAAISEANDGRPLENAILSAPPVSKDKQECASAPGNGEVHPGKQRNASGSENGVDLWEQISEALSAKKAQLSQESTWAKASSNRGSWSYRALKGSALGPTMALLRSKNKL